MRYTSRSRSSCFSQHRSGCPHIRTPRPIRSQASTARSSSVSPAPPSRSPTTGPSRGGASCSASSCPMTRVVPLCRRRDDDCADDGCQGERADAGVGDLLGLDRAEPRCVDSHLQSIVAGLAHEIPGRAGWAARQGHAANRIAHGDARVLFSNGRRPQGGAGAALGHRRRAARN